MAAENLTVGAMSSRRIEFAPTGIEASAGNKFLNDGKTMLYVENGAGGSTLTVTMQTGKKVDGLPVADLTGTVAAGKAAVFGPFPKDLFDDLEEVGYVVITWSGGTAPKAQPFTLP